VQITDKKFLTMLAKDFLAGELTTREFVEQVADSRIATEEENITTYLASREDVKVGQLLRAWWEGVVFDTNWEGYGHDERVAVNKWLGDMVHAEELMLAPTPSDPDTDRSKGGAVPDGA
jgi:hypothetical protein